MIKLEIIGAKANWSRSFSAKGFKKFTSCFFETDYKFQIDAGNAWDKRKIDYLLITHLHKDHIAKIESYPKKVVFCLPSEKFRKTIPKGDRILLLDKASKIGKTRIRPFLVHHSKTSLTYGFKIIFRSASFIWLPDYFSPFDFSIFKNANYYFLGASSLKKDILHRGYLTGQKSIFHFLKQLEKRKLFPKKKIYLIHLGLTMFPLQDKIEWLRKQFRQYKIIPARDKMKINLC